MACRPSVRGVDSSVIFLVVIGLWAAILVPHWLRRREHLSHSRSVDRFSAAMRVLTRRPAPEELPDRSRTSTYVLTPPREQRALEAAPPATRGWPPRRLHRPAPVRRRPHRGFARVLGALLLVSLLAVPVLGALSVAGLLLPWAAAPAVGTALVLLVALRTSARRRRRLATSVVPVAHVAVVAHPADDVVTDAGSRARSRRPPARSCSTRPSTRRARSRPGSGAWPRRPCARPTSRTASPSPASGPPSPCRSRRTC